MLRKGRWYRNPGGGILEVERVGFSGAEARIFHGTKQVSFESNGKNVGFVARKITRMTISSGSILEPVAPVEVKRFMANGNGRRS